MNLAVLAGRLTLYERLMRLDKPIGTLLLLWPTMWALWLASDGSPEGRTQGGVPVYNVSVPVLRRAFPERPPFRVLEVPVVDGD